MFDDLSTLVYGIFMANPSMRPGKLPGVLAASFIAAGFINPEAGQEYIASHVERIQREVVYDFGEWFLHHGPEHIEIDLSEFPEELPRTVGKTAISSVVQVSSSTLTREQENYMLTLGFDAAQAREYQSPIGTGFLLSESGVTITAGHAYYDDDPKGLVPRSCEERTFTAIHDGELHSTRSTTGAIDHMPMLGDIHYDTKDERISIKDFAILSADKNLSSTGIEGARLSTKPPKRGDHIFLYNYQVNNSAVSNDGEKISKIRDIGLDDPAVYGGIVLDDFDPTSERPLPFMSGFSSVGTETEDYNLNEGASGGPVFNEDGEIVGIIIRGEVNTTREQSIELWSNTTIVDSNETTPHTDLKIGYFVPTAHPYVQEMVRRVESGEVDSCEHINSHLQQ